MNSNPLSNLQELQFSQIVSEAKEIAEGIEKTWKRSKTFHYVLRDSSSIDVDVFKNLNLNGDYWAARVTDFKSCGEDRKEEYFNDLRKYLIGTSNLEQSHTKYEKEYIHELIDYKLKPFNLEVDLGILIAAYTSKMVYRLPFPLSERVFHELILVYEDKQLEFSIVSLSIDPKVFSDEEDTRVKATYTSIEKVYYNESAKSLKWIMCTCSNAGGYVPKYFVNMGMNSAVAKDVPSFFNWTMEKKG